MVRLDIDHSETQDIDHSETQGIGHSENTDFSMVRPIFKWMVTLMSFMRVL